MQNSAGVAIFWDYENCHVPSSLSGYDVVARIRSLARSHGSIKSFKAYFEISGQTQRPLALRSELQSSGVSLIDCPHNGRKDVADKMIIVDMLAHAMDNPAPSTTIFLITGDRDFAYAISTLSLRNYCVVVVTLPNAHISLTAQAHSCLEWNRDVLRASSTTRQHLFNKAGTFMQQEKFLSPGSLSANAWLPRERGKTDRDEDAGFPRGPRKVIGKRQLASTDASKTCASSGQDQSEKDVPSSQGHGHQGGQTHATMATSLLTIVSPKMIFQTDFGCQQTRGTASQSQVIGDVFTTQEENNEADGQIDDDDDDDGEDDDYDDESCSSVTDVAKCEEDSDSQLEEGDKSCFSVSVDSVTSEEEEDTNDKEEEEEKRLSLDIGSLSQPQSLGNIVSEVDAIVYGDEPHTLSRATCTFCGKPNIFCPGDHGNAAQNTCTLCGQGLFAELPSTTPSTTVHTISTSAIPTVSSAKSIPIPTESAASFRSIKSLKHIDIGKFTISVQASKPNSTTMMHPANVTIPNSFKILVRCLLAHKAQGCLRPLRSLVAAEIGNDGSTYQRAGVTKFGQYVAIAERLGLIELGGQNSEAWIRLKPAFHHTFVS